MKNIVLAVFFAFLAHSLALAADVKDNAKNQAVDVAGKLASGKSTKDVANEKKEEAKDAVKAEAGKQMNKLLNF